MHSDTPGSKFTAADLVCGAEYRVVSEFVDFDGKVHRVGELWRFLRKNFLPYEDGLSLFVEEGGSEVHIRLQWRPETQGRTIDRFSDLVERL